MSLLKTNEIQNYNGSSLTLTASTVSTSAQLNTGGNISVTGSLNVSDDSTTRTNLGLGTIATQDSNNINLTGGTIGSGVVFPTGHVVQVKRDKSAETNTLTASYPGDAFYDLGITVKTNSPDIWWVLNTSYYATAEFGVQIRVSTSSTVTNTDTLIWDEQTSNSTGPNLAGSSAAASFGVISLNSIYESTALIGDTLYFGFFARLYNTGTVQISPASGSAVTQGTIAFTLIEVQG